MTLNFDLLNLESIVSSFLGHPSVYELLSMQIEQFFDLSCYNKV